MQQSICQAIVLPQLESLVGPLAWPTALSLEGLFEALVKLRLSELVLRRKLGFDPQGCYNVSELGVCSLQCGHCRSVIAGLAARHCLESCVGRRWHCCWTDGLLAHVSVQRLCC